MLQKITNYIINLGANEEIAITLGWIAVLLSILLLSIIANYIAKKILSTGFTQVIKKTKTNWDDILLEREFRRCTFLEEGIAMARTICQILPLSDPSRNTDKMARVLRGAQYAYSCPPGYSPQRNPA